MMPRLLVTGMTAVLLMGCVSKRGDAAEAPAIISATSPGVEGTAHGFPVLRDLAGRKLANGEFVQWLVNEHVHARITYEFSSAHRIEEKTVFRQKPRIIEEEWSWCEFKDGKVYRKFEVDFGSGKASSEKWDGKKFRRWAMNIKVEPDRMFAGYALALAIKNLRERLNHGETIQLKAIGFTPKPRVVLVEISHVGIDRIRMSDRVIESDRFVIHPRIPWFVRLFVTAPDMRIWLIHAPPAEFLRWEGPLIEPEDPMVRVDLLSGSQSEMAEPRRP